VPLHLIMDNYGTPKKQEVRTWLKKHLRFVLPFVPSSSSLAKLIVMGLRHPPQPCSGFGCFTSGTLLPLPGRPSFRDGEDSPLNDYGVAVLHESEQLGVVIDLSHMGTARQFSTFCGEPACLSGM
jgi:hypothetical protein